MIYKHSRYLILIMSLLSSQYKHIESKILLPGNSDSTQSFTFNIGPTASYSPNARFYIGSKDASVAKDYAVSVAMRNNRTNELRFFPIAPEQLIVNLEKDDEGAFKTARNPLFDEQIELLTTYGTNLLITKLSDPNVVYFLENFLTSQPFLFISPKFNDAQGLPTKGILALETQTAQSQGVVSEKNDAPVGFFVAVTNQDNNFNGNGSGIAYAVVDFPRKAQSIVISDAQADPIRFQKKAEPIESEKKDSSRDENSSDPMTSRNSDQISTNNGSADEETGQPVQQEEIPKNDGNRARAINLNEFALTIGGDLLDIKDAVALRWDSLLQRLYVGLQTQASQGALSVLLASTATGVINFQKIVSDSAISGDNQIIGTTVPGSSVSVHALSTLQTSTYLTYLIVHGGNGTPQQTNNRVFALPLIQNPEAEDGSHGSLANVNASPVAVFGEAPFFRFRLRKFVTPALNPSDLYTQNSIEAQVGGGPAPAPITKLVAFKDTVFISTALAGDTEEAGLFYSQALFDNIGRIKGWTTWRRTGGAGPLAGFNYASMTGDFYTIPVINGATNSGYMSTWSTGETQFEKLVQDQFPKIIAGVQGITDFGRTTSGFSQEIGSRLSVATLTGFQKVLFLQTGSDQDGIFTSSDLNFEAELFTNAQGRLENFVSARALSISGGALDELKAIVCAEYINDGKQGWWVVGGAGGIAILAQPDGTGVAATSGLQKNFVGMNSHMQFIKIDSPLFVRKILSFGNHVYALTPYSLERITITPESIVTGVCERVVLANAKEVTKKFIDTQSSFSDMAISGPLAVIASSIGLIRSGSGVDIQNATNQDAVNWTLIPLNEVTGSFPTSGKVALGPITQLLTINPTENSKEWYHNDRGIAGNMYILNADVGYHQAQVYRINFNDGPVNDRTLMPFLDFFVGGIPSFFVNLTDYRNGIQTDGAIFFTGRSAYLRTPPYISVLSDAVRSGQVNGGGVRSTLTVLREDDYRSLGRIIRLNALASWAVNGDFGIRLHN